MGRLLSTGGKSFTMSTPTPLVYLPTSRRCGNSREGCGVLPRGAVLESPEDLHPYECDGLSAYRQLAGLVALPESIDQVQQILRLCSRYQAANQLPRARPFGRNCVNSGGSSSE